MKHEDSARQLYLFPGERIAWETLTTECQHDIRQLLSLLIEQAGCKQQKQSNDDNDNHHTETNPCQKK